MAAKPYAIGVIGCGVIWERGHWGAGLRHIPEEEARELSFPQGTPPGRVDAYRNLIRAIEEGTPLYASAVEGLRVTEILEAGLISRTTGRKQRVELHEL